MNIPTFIIGTLLIIAAAGLIVSLFKKGKHGTCSSCDGCTCPCKQKSQKTSNHNY